MASLWKHSWESTDGKVTALENFSILGSLWWISQEWFFFFSFFPAWFSFLFFSLKWEGWPQSTPEDGINVPCSCRKRTADVYKQGITSRYQLWFHSASLSPNTCRTRLPVQICRHHTASSRVSWRCRRGLTVDFAWDSSDFNNYKKCVCVSVCEMTQLSSETLRMTFLRPVSTQFLDVTTQAFFPQGNSVLGLLKNIWSLIS